MTGCDTTSYPANVGKVKPLKTMIKFIKENFLVNLCKCSVTKKCLKMPWPIFFSGIYYARKEKETRCRGRLKQNAKSGTNLIPMEHLKQPNLQTYMLKQSLEKNIEMTLIEERDWKYKEGRI